MDGNSKSSNDNNTMENEEVECSNHRDAKREVILTESRPSLLPATSKNDQDVTSKTPINAILSKSNIHPSLPIVELECLKAAISSKASPSKLKSWAQLSLTLDGRDKITKIIQYTARLVAYYYENTIWKHQRATPYRNLQKALTQARKAYRFGRTFTELEKIREMGLVHWIAWYMREVIFYTNHDMILDEDQQSNGATNEKRVQNQNSTICWHTDIQNSNNDDENKKSNSDKANQPPRILLPRRVSSNIGWGPASSMSLMDQSLNEKSRSKSYTYSNSMSRIFYRSLSSYIDESRLNVTTKPPPWKIWSSALKLLFLGGFWAGDNISYLYSVGFLTQSQHSSEKEPKGLGAGIGEKAAIFSTRSYFFAAVVGLYMNSKEFIIHRYGPLREAINQVVSAQKSMKEAEYSENVSSLDQHDLRLNLEKKIKELESIQRKHFSLTLALVKSICDVMVFSNNAGVDLHKKYRGKKMNEGLQCLFGITSAMTVIYNNYPNK